MNEIEFANVHFGAYTRKGAEIIPKECPFCCGGDRHDKNTFALNTEKHTYNCKRGSCQKSGHFTDLCHTFNETADKSADSAPAETTGRPAYVKKQYKPSRAVTSAPTDRVTAYITSRGITPETMAVFGIGTSEEGNISFPFYGTAEDFKARKATFTKYRIPGKIPHGAQKMWRETDTEPILFGLHLCDPAQKMLFITEGEFDCMAVYQAAEGSVNVVSVPSGANDFTWVETCADVLLQYENISFFGDSDTPGQKMLADISSKLGGEKTILAPDFNTYRGCKDANEILFRHGTAGIAAVITSMKPMPVKGLLDLAEVREVDLSKTGRITTGITALDNATGGMLDGDLSVWTGKRGEGKSAFLNQIAIEAVEQDRNVCIYSGEVPVDRLKYQINLCAAGKENILKKPDTLTERTLCYLDHKNLTALDGWYGRRIWLYDNRIIELDERDSVIEKFTQAFRRYDCRVFIVDNLMTISIGAKANEVLQTQADFINRLRKFAEKYNVHVHCVVHPRKTKMVSDSDEVGGMGSITNIACNVFNIRKLDETSGGYLGTGIDGRPKIVQYNSELKILKNRAYGDTGDIALVYDKEAQRFTQHGNMPKKYAWIKGMERWEYVDEIPDM